METRTIVGVDTNCSWDASATGRRIYFAKFDYIGHGAPRLYSEYKFLGYGLYRVKIINNDIENEEYDFYIDFQDSKFLNPINGERTDIDVIYDFSKPINQRVRVQTDAFTINPENGKIYRIWSELQLVASVREGIFLSSDNIPISNLTADTLFSPSILDGNTNISAGKTIIIDPLLYPEPQKLNDLKLTINNGIMLNTENSSTLKIGDGAEVSLGNSSIINIATGGNLFIGSNSEWSFNPGSQLLVNGNFKITSKIPVGWQMLSVPNLVSDFTKTVVWQNAISDALTFEGGVYVKKNTLEKGKGYWVNFDAAQNIDYAGPPILNGASGEYNVVSGWNMIGAASLNLLTSHITSYPQGIVSSKFYSFGASGYQEVDEIKPGLGYWIKVSQNGKLKMDIYSSASTTPPQCSNTPTANPQGAPSIPKLVWPDSSSSGITNYPTLRWRASNDVSTYYLQISTNSCFTNLVYDDPMIIDTIKVIGLSYSTKYYWRVSALGNTAQSAWSNVWYFTTTLSPHIDPCDPIESFATMDNITISDASGNSQKMFVHNGHRAIDVGMSDFDLPPVPPKNHFNARFQSGKFIETVLPNNKIKRMPISVNNASFPIKIKWDTKQQNSIQYWLRKPGKINEKVSLSGSGELVLDDLYGNTLVLETQAVAPGPCNSYKAGIKEPAVELVNIPNEYALGQNYPNPFNPITMISYQLPTNGFVTLKVYDVLGKEVATLINEYKEAGYHDVEFNATNLSSGVYFYKLQAGNFVTSKKMLLSR